MIYFNNSCPINITINTFFPTKHKNRNICLCLTKQPQERTRWQFLPFRAKTDSTWTQCLFINNSSDRAAVPDAVWQSVHWSRTHRVTRQAWLKKWPSPCEVCFTDNIISTCVSAVWQRRPQHVFCFSPSLYRWWWLLHLVELPLGYWRHLLFSLNSKCLSQHYSTILKFWCCVKNGFSVWFFFYFNTF